MFPANATSIPVNIDVHPRKDTNGFPSPGYSPAGSPSVHKGPTGSSPLQNGRFPPAAKIVTQSSHQQMASSSSPRGTNIRINHVSNSPVTSNGVTQPHLPVSNQPSPPGVKHPNVPVGMENIPNLPFNMNQMNMNMNEQMRKMESDMQKMQQHMQSTFHSFPGAPPPLLAPPQPPFPSPLPLLGQDGLTQPQLSINGFPTGNQDSLNGSINNNSGNTTPGLLTTNTLTPGGADINRALTPPPMDMRPLTPDLTGSASPGLYPGDMMTTGPDGRKQLKLQFNMQDFDPGDVQVKANKNRLEVSAHHEEKEPNRVSCRVFHQQYQLPQDVRLAKTQSFMSPGGVLDVESKVKPNYRVKFAGDNNDQTALQNTTTIYQP